MNNDEKREPLKEATPEKAQPVSQQTDGADDRLQNPEQEARDKIEGRMDNGEIGGGLKKEE